MRLFFSLFLSLFIAQSFIKAEAKDLVITASINPIYQIVLAITQDKANTRLIINPNSSEHDYRFKRKDVKFISKSDLIFYVSDELENKFLKLITNYGKKSQSFELVDVSGMKILLKRGDINKVDSHIWLNPQNGVVIAEFVMKKVSEIDPGNSEKYQNNLEIFKKEVRNSEKKIRTNLGEIKSGNGFIFYHDGYQYFEDYFNVRPLKIVTYNHDTELTVGSMKEIDILVKSKQVRCIFTDPQDEKNSAMRLAKNYQIKFSILDLIGVKENLRNKEVNGYSSLLLNMSDDMLACLR